MAVHASVLILVLCAVYFALPFKTLFSWHPLFMIVGLYGFVLQGIIVYNKFSSLVPNATANRKYNLHALLQIAGILSILAGCAVIYKVKNDNYRPHLQSWHGFLGAIFVLYGISQSVFGFLKSRAFLRRWVKPKISRKMHAVSGALYFALGCLVTGLGFRSDWFQQTALVNAIQDQGVRMLVDYVLMFLLCLLALVVTKQIYDRYFVGEEIAISMNSAQSKKMKKSK